jgi:hypothetical protein
VLFSRLRGQPLFSEAVDRPLSDTEIAAGLDRLEPLLKERAPVLLPAFRAHAADLRATAALGSAEPGVVRASRRDLETPLAKVRALCQQVVEIPFEELARGKEPGAYDTRQPFRGLTAFGVRDRPFFFGRAEDIKRLQAKLAPAAPLKLLPVLGASGSGKSSLVLAGLLPELRPELKLGRAGSTGANAAVAEAPAYPVMRPGAAPLAAFEATLAALPDATAPLVVDQFEEVFTLTPAAGRRERLAPFFARLLAEAERRPLPGSTVAHPKTT